MNQQLLISYKGSTAPTSMLLLDQLGKSAVVAYGMRKLRAAYSGAGVKVRRESDDFETDIGFDGSGTLDWDAAVGLGDTLRVVVWYDQSGNGNDLEVYSYIQPSLNTSLKRIEFNGTTQNLFTATAIDLGGTNKVTFFGVVQTNDLDADQRIFELSDTYNEFKSDAFVFVAGGASYTAAMYGGAYNYQSIPNTINNTLLTAVLDKSQTGAAQTVIRLNGGGTSSGGTEDAAGNFGNYVINVGARNRAANYLNGSMKEIVLFPTAFNLTELGTAESNINGFYSIY